MPARNRRTTDGQKIGRSASSKIGFYGTEPVSRPAHADQGALTDNSGGTASLTIAAIGATYNQEEVRNAVASLARSVNRLRTELVALGLIKGSA
jgi:predicted HD phosphohydrolase